MLNYLGRLLKARNEPVPVSFLTRVEVEPQWQSGMLVSVDIQGACFMNRVGDEVECLPWGSITSIKVHVTSQES